MLDLLAPTAPTNQPPTVATAASAVPNPVPGITSLLSVLGADDGGESNLTYTWVTTGTPPAAVSFSANGTNAAKTTTASFAKAGNYSFQVTIKDAGNLTVTSSVNVTVSQALTTVTVSPASAGLLPAGAQAFSAAGLDQFNAAMIPQPTWTWTVSGGGGITSAGLFTAGPVAGGPFTVTATGGAKSGTATVTVLAPANQPPTVSNAAWAAPNPVTGATAALSVLGADDGGESNLVYTWSTTGVPAAAVSFSPNGTNAAKNTTLTFAKAGSYGLRVTIQDAAGLRVTSSVTVTVNQTLATIVVSPLAAGVLVGATQDFSAAANDQFGSAMSPQPALSWTVSGGGAIDNAGLFTAGPAAGGPFTVTATGGAKNGTASVTVVAAGNNPPTVATAASANPSLVTGKSASLSVLGADDGGEAGLSYSWSTTGIPPAVVSYSANGTNAAKNTTVTFSKAGSYGLRVTIQDANGLSVTSSVTVTVNQALAAIVVSPQAAGVPVGATQDFNAAANDQFGSAMSPQPAMTWTVSGGGAIDNTGLFTAGPAAGGPFTVTASGGGKSGAGSVTVLAGPNQAPTVASAASATPNPVTGTSAALRALGADDGGESNLTYTWSTTGVPAAGVSFSVNATNAAKNTTATLSQAGAYSLQVMIRDSGGLSVTSSVNVTVNPTVTSVSVNPPTATVTVQGSQGFTAQALDQFSQAMAGPPVFIWTVSAGGSITGSGLFTAGATAGGPFAVTATSGGQSGTAAVTVTGVESPSPLPDLSLYLGAINGRTYALTDEITFSYPISGVRYAWSFEQRSAEARGPGSEIGQSSFPGALPSALTFPTTSAPRFTPASAGLAPGTYLLTVTVSLAGSAPQSASATITLVAADLNGVKVYPNPWRTDKHSGKPVTFANLPIHCSAKIFTVDGHLTKDLGWVSGTIPWDLTDESGGKVASGIYVYLIKDGQGNMVRGKVGVIR